MTLVVSCIDGKDPFTDIEFRGLVNRVMPESDRCSTDGMPMVHDNNLPTCNDMEDERWDETFMSQLGQSNESLDNEDDNDNDSLPVSNITSFKEAIAALEDIQAYLESHGYPSTSVSYIGPAVDAIMEIKVNSTRQSTLHDYFASVTQSQ